MAFLFFSRTGVNGWVGKVGNFDKHCIVFFVHKKYIENQWL